MTDRWERTKGVTLRESSHDSVMPEAVRDNWDQISDFTDSLHPKNQNV